MERCAVHGVDSYASAVAIRGIRVALIRLRSGAVASLFFVPIYLLSEAAVVLSLTAVSLLLL